MRAGVRLRPHAGGVVADRRQPSHRRRERRRPVDQAPDRHGARRGGRTREGAPHARAGRAGVLLAFVGRRTRLAAECRRGQCSPRGYDALLARLAEPVSPHRPPLAGADRACGADDQGPHLHADWRDDRRPDHVAARDAGRRAQLGLPLHVDARLDVHAPGAAFPQPRLGGRRVHAVRRRPRAQRRRRPADHVWHRRPTRPHRVHAGRPLGLRRRAARARRQRRVRSTPERRVRSGAGLDPATYAAQRAPAEAAMADRANRRRPAQPSCGASPTRASGRPAASPSTTCPRS